MERKRNEEWTILDRWYKDDQYREVQSQRHGWTIEWVKCLDHLAEIDISYKATVAQRNRNECNINVLATIPISCRTKKRTTYVESSRIHRKSHETRKNGTLHTFQSINVKD